MANALKIGGELIADTLQAVARDTSTGLHTLGNLMLPNGMNTPGAAFEDALKRSEVWGDYQPSKETQEFQGFLKDFITKPYTQSGAGKIVAQSLADAVKNNPGAAMQTMGALAITDVIPGFNKLTTPAKVAVKKVIAKGAKPNDLVHQSAMQANEANGPDLTIDDVHVLLQAKQGKTYGKNYYEYSAQLAEKKENLKEWQQSDVDYVNNLRKEEARFATNPEPRNLILAKEQAGRPIDANLAKAMDKARIDQGFVVPVAHNTPYEIDPRGLTGADRGIPYVAITDDMKGMSDFDKETFLRNWARASVGQTDPYGGPGKHKSMTAGLNRAYEVGVLRDDIRRMEDRGINTKNEAETYAHLKRRLDVETGYLEASLRSDAAGWTTIPMYAKRGILGHVADEADKKMQLEALANAMSIPDSLSDRQIGDLISRQKGWNQDPFEATLQGKVSGIPGAGKYPDYLPPTRGTRLDMSRANIVAELLEHQQRTQDAPDVLKIAEKHIRQGYTDLEIGGGWNVMPKTAKYLKDAGFTGKRVEDEMDGLSVAIFDPDFLRHRYYGFGLED
jgi:hypothetical protein